jgi:predicted enzyme related to lactoylglutathione lyase
MSDASLTAVRENGGQVLCEPESIGSHRAFAVIHDPAGAICALHQPAAQ